jgi:hypothetical protein
VETNVTLTEEHIFPEAAGGKIKADLLCKPCNDKLGSTVDAEYLKQKPVELARNAYSVAGKTGNVPQPFSEAYPVKGTDLSLRVKLDEDFAPRVVPSQPHVSVTEDGELRFTGVWDAKDRDQIPQIVRIKLSRFFKSERGRALGWSYEQQQTAIRKSVAEAEQVPVESQRIQEPLHGQWCMDLSALFAEHVKVIYEAGCHEWGKSFMGSQAGSRLRRYLHDQCSGQARPEKFSEMAKRLKVVPNVPPDINQIVENALGLNR